MSEKPKKDFVSACATLLTGEAGRTGDWRSERPVIDLEQCTPSKKGKPSCFLCWLYCPDAAIKRAIPVEVDLQYCKGCGICAAECPTQAIRMVPEEEFIAVDCKLTAAIDK